MGGNDQETAAAKGYQVIQGLLPMKPIPDWITTYVAEWKQILYLHEWTIKTRLSPHPNGDSSGSTKAAVSIYPDILVADIEFRDDAPERLEDCSEADAEEWRKTVIHELLHVKLGRVTELVSQDIIPELAGSAQEMAHKMLRREVEPFVETMSGILYRLKERTDA